VDPLADKYPGWSPYVYALDNPLIIVDPDGKAIFRAGEGYLTADRAQQLTLEAMINAMRGKPSKIDFVGESNNVQDIFKNWFRKHQYSQTYFNPYLIQFGERVSLNTPLGNQTRPEYQVNTVFHNKNLLYNGLQREGKNDQGEDIVNLFFTTEGSEQTVIKYTNTVSNLNKIIEKMGKRLQRFETELTFRNKKTGKIWKETRYSYRMADLE
jgi:hypothetical protein